MNSQDYTRGAVAGHSKVARSGDDLGRLPGVIPFGDTLWQALRQWQSDFAPRHYPQMASAEAPERRTPERRTPEQRRVARRMDWDSQLP